MNPLVQQEQTLIRAGHQSFFGAFAQQNPAAFLSFNRLLNAHSFDTIIELGTHDGGLSTVFALYCYLSKHTAWSTNEQEPSLYKNKTHHRSPKQFVTFDNVRRDEEAIAALKHLGALFMQQDTLFDEENIAGIRRMIGNEKNGTVLLLCDGGNKKRELELYGSALKPGDFVCLHDWAANKTVAAENAAKGIWHSHEVMWNDGIGEGQQFGIGELCHRYGIEHIYADEFDKVAWFVGVKR